MRRHKSNNASRGNFGSIWFVTYGKRPWLVNVCLSIDKM
jgi:hypothetical protein